VHRRVEHPSTLKCKYYPKCTWGEKCLYVHEEEDNMEVGTPATQENIQTVKHKCRVCGNDFTNKPDLMKHRKAVHSNVVSLCRDFLSSHCGRGDERCWYRHNTSQPQPNPQQAPVNTSAKEVFQKTTPPQHPPEQMEMVINMLKALQTQVNQMQQK